MNINKSDLKDGFTFIWMAIVFLLLTVDVAFPFIMFVIKFVFYAIALALFVLGIGTVIRSLFGKKNTEI